jgi:hypothetical protein
MTGTVGRKEISDGLARLEPAIHCLYTARFVLSAMWRAEP